MEIELQNYFKLDLQDNDYCVLITNPLNVIICNDNKDKLTVLDTNGGKTTLSGRLGKEWIYCYNDEDLYLGRADSTSAPIRSINGVTHFSLLSGAGTFYENYTLTETTVKCDYYEVAREHCREFSGAIGTCVPIKYGGKNMYQFVDLFNSELYIIECLSTYRDYISGTILKTKHVVCPNVIYLVYVIEKNKIPKSIKYKILCEYQNIFQLITRELN